MILLLWLCLVAIASFLALGLKIKDRSCRVPGIDQIEQLILHPIHLSLQHFIYGLSKHLIRLFPIVVSLSADSYGLTRQINDSLSIG